MDGSFACPECGNELRLKGTTPGRQLRCGWCETWVEVPFLPRTTLRGRRSRRRPPWVPWAWAGLGVLAILIVVLGSTHWMRSRARALQVRALDELVAGAKANDRAGQLEAAVADFDKAIKAARKLEPPRPGRVAELEEWRLGVARRLAESRFEKAAHAGPAEAIATYKSLLARVWTDPALVGLESRLRDRLETTRREWAEADVAAARKALAEGRPTETIDLCERLVVTAEELPQDTLQRLQREATAMVTAIVESKGVVYSPVHGQFTEGSPSKYSERFDPIFDAAFIKHGYVPRRPRSPWKDVWDSRAPYRLTMEIIERQGGTYSSSNNRITLISTKLNLYRGDISFWQVGPLVAQTQPSIPSLEAFTAARGGPNERSSAKFERILYEDAWDTIRDRIKVQLEKLTDYRKAPH